MKNFFQQLKRLGIALLITAGIELLGLVAALIDKSGGISFVIMIAGCIFGAFAVLRFLFLIIASPNTIDEVLTDVEKENNRRFQSSPLIALNQRVTQKKIDTSANKNDPTTKIKKLRSYNPRTILFVSFVFFLGFLAVASKQIHLLPYPQYGEISPSLGSWLWWPLFGIFALVLMAGSGGRVVYRDSWGVRREGYIENYGGGGGSLSIIAACLFSYIVIYMSLCVYFIWFQHSHFPKDIDWPVLGPAIFSFFFLSAAFFFLFKSGNWKSHIFLYVLMLAILIIARM
jgi:hypothetical protein